MAIMKMSSTISDEFETENTNEELKKDGILFVRPCERYNELLRSCRSIRGRLHQYYVYGELFDCSEHKNNYNNCMKFRSTQNPDVLDPIIEWETNLIQTRLNAAKNNKAWAFRKSPPSDFEKPLPEFLQKRQQKTLFGDQ